MMNIWIVMFMNHCARTHRFVCFCFRLSCTYFTGSSANWFVWRAIDWRQSKETTAKTLLNASVAAWGWSWPQSTLWCEWDSIFTSFVVFRVRIHDHETPSPKSNLVWFRSVFAGLGNHLMTKFTHGLRPNRESGVWLYYFWTIDSYYHVQGD